MEVGVDPEDTLIVMEGLNVVQNVFLFIGPSFLNSFTHFLQQLSQNSLQQ